MQDVERGSTTAATAGSLGREAVPVQKSANTPFSFKQVSWGLTLLLTTVLLGVLTTAVVIAHQDTSFDNTKLDSDQNKTETKPILDSVQLIPRNKTTEEAEFVITTTP